MSSMPARNACAQDLAYRPFPPTQGLTAQVGPAGERSRLGLLQVVDVAMEEADELLDYLDGEEWDDDEWDEGEPADGGEADSEGEALDDGDGPVDWEAMLRDPEVGGPEIAAKMAELTASAEETWCTTPVPVLGDRSPMEAVADLALAPDVRTMLRNLERRDTVMSPARLGLDEPSP